MLPSFLVYGGLVIVSAGVLSLIRPLRFIRIRSRRTAAAVAAVGFVLVFTGFAFPVSESRERGPRTQLDDFMPVWHFDETHTQHVDASPERVYAAVRDVRANEILFFRLLTTIRRLGRKAPESVLNAPDTEPILDVATRSGFIRLADESPNELVVGTMVVAPISARGGQLTAETFRTQLPPGFALAAMNFTVAPDKSGGSIVSTETRVFASDRSARRSFAVYWRIIHPGSDIIRRMWLRAVKRRAEQVT